MIKKDHKKNLNIHGVTLPKFGTAKSYWLCVLWIHKGSWISKNDISTVVQKYTDLAPDQQVRHLVNDGWNVENDKGYHRLINLSKPNKDFTNQKNKRSSNLKSSSWEKIKKSWNHRCATCGSKEGEKHFIYSDQGVKLTKGHMNPESSLDYKNIIPQCEQCNRSYKDDFTFDNRGRIRAVASIRPIEKASQSVKDKIFKWARDKNET